MVDNFLSAGTQGDDEELPSPYGTGPKNRATEEHRRSDYDNDTWQERGSGLDPAPSLPNAPRTYERGPVPQQPYVPKPPYLPSAPPPPQQAPRTERPEYYGESREEPYGREYQEQNPFRPQAPAQQPAQSPAPGRPSPFGPGSGSNGAAGAQQPPRPQGQSGNGTPPRPAPSSNGSTNWTTPATPPSPFGAQPQPPAASNGLSTYSSSNGHSSNGSSPASSNGSSNGSSSNGLSSPQPPRPPQRPEAPRAQEGRAPEPTRRYEPGPGPEPVWSHEPVRPPEPVQETRHEPAQEPRREPARPPELARRREEETRPQEIRLRPRGQSHNGYLSDPSAEYESNAPVSDEAVGAPVPEQPRVPGAARPIGARRRADVQQDAPSQVPAEQVSSPRGARRAQAAPAQQATPEQQATPVQQAAAQQAAPAKPTSPAERATPVQQAAPVSNPAEPSASNAPEAAAATPASEASEVSPYGGGSSAAKRSGDGAPAADAPKRPRRYRVHHLRDFKSRGEKWAMLTAYDQYTAEIFDQAGIPVLLVGDSAANNVFGYDTTLRVTVDELIPLARAVAGAVERALVVADLPFGSYQASPEQAFHTAVRFMKEAGVHAVKLEGGRTVVPMVEKLTQSGIPVMAHIGFTPQSEHSIGGYRVQGRGDQAAGLIDDAVALAAAGAFSVVLEMVPGDVAAEITKRVPIPTIGIGAGRDTDAQVLVWQDMAGLRSGTMPRFVKQYADLRGILVNAAATYASEVASGAFPGEEHTF
ncbi:3-methyl-2-oxobutanoate hydroxymethyltransferase [Kribbella sp. NPDC003505]|uniref:3-methyl-2-oxobutanoate hydroxymethyltransferase n=1 Tax=Kribbella sp. NPDC003505 TaxID=3154448 RepID=UPI0033B110A4